MYQKLLILAIILLANISQAQVTCTPVFPGPDDNITITFNAKEGNMGLASETGDVYAHTGVITDKSTSASDWKFVKFPWTTNDPSVKMTPKGNGIYTLSINNIRAFYAVPAADKILKLAFVFRNSNGSKEGKTAAGGDIFYDIYSSSSALKTLLITPNAPTIYTTIGQMIDVKGAASIASNLTLTDNGTLIASASTAKELTKTITVTGEGGHTVVFKAELNGVADSASFTYTVSPTITIADPPKGAELGANINTKGDSVTLLFQAPLKQSVYVIGSFNNYQIDTKYLMKKSVDGKTWWLSIGGLTPGQIYTYQYLVDGVLNVADPLSTLVLDPNNDRFIPSITYPNMPVYPVRATGIVSVLEPGKTPYVWKTTNYTRPEKKDLVIYELHIRDFIARHDYQTLIDTIAYLKNLGITAIELMPVSEFSGNESWGYNPIFHNALDKYYGTIDKFKEFVDKCHANGIALILDIVFNQADNASPLAKLYWDGSKPSVDNPFLNPTATHPFSVFNDFNHESEYTKNYVDRCLKYWLTEYKIDGYRFDLAKGFTQKVSNNDGVFAAYDQSRVDILKHYHQTIQAAAPGAYTILELFSDNSEETTLATEGMMVWANVNGSSNEATMGYTGNSLTRFSSKARGWNDAKHDKHIAYMESHDEERLMYKNLQYGNASGNYSIKNDLNISLKRIELISAFFYTVPGPRMLWQFGELGYDINIDFNGRTGNKPIRWDYYADNARKRIYNVTRNLLELRKNNAAFRTTNYSEADLSSGYSKAFHVQDADFNLTVIGNFDVVANDVNPAFQKTGLWYNFLTGDSINITDKNGVIRLLPGEYRVYTSMRQPKPAGGYVRYTLTGTEEFANQVNEFMVYPTPSVSGNIFIGYNLKNEGDVQWTVYNSIGQQVSASNKKLLPQGSYQDALNMSLSAGTYLVKLTVNGATATKKCVIQR